MKHARSDYDLIQDGRSKGAIPKDEPVFLLRAKDQTAADIVRQWIHAQTFNPNADSKMILMAERHATLMEQWPEKKWADLPHNIKRLTDDAKEA